MRASVPPIVHIGNPENRRITLFAQALQDRGLPPARVFSWQQIAENPEILLSLPDTPHIVRLDSAGEDFELERTFLLRGAELTQHEPCWKVPSEKIRALEEDNGRILAPRQCHMGYMQVVQSLAPIFAKRATWQVFPHPSTVTTLFDKRITSRLYAAHGIPVPPSLEFSPQSVRALLHAAQRQQIPEVFVKLASGSSASCMGLFHTERIQFFTSMERTPQGQLYNNLRPRTYTGNTALALVELLLREGAQVETALPKGRLLVDDTPHFFDFRVLVIDQKAAFTVVRQSSIPITNLHLGGQRGELSAVEARYPGAIAQAHAAAEAVARLHPDCLHVGVDVMVEDQGSLEVPVFAGVRVIEANAFGDLLPNLTRDGLSVYAYEIERLKSRFSIP